MLGIGAEGFAFLEAALSGMTVYSAYLCIRAFRRIVKHDLWAIAAEDFIFWLGTAFYLFTQMFHTTNGSIRWYFALGVAFGAAALLFATRQIRQISGKINRKNKRSSVKTIEQRGKNS